MIDSLKYIGLAIVLAFFQAFIIQQVDLGFWLFPMPYLYLFFVLPINFNRFGYLFLAFVFGTIVDFLSGSFGTHAASCLAMVFAKNFIDERFIDFESLQLQGEQYLNTQSKGLLTFFYYALSLIAIHHLVFFSLDYFEWRLTFHVILTTIVSSLGSLLLILMYKGIFGR